MSSADSAQNAARWTPDHNCIQYAIGQSRDLPPKATSPDDDVSASERPELGVSFDSPFTRRSPSLHVDHPNGCRGRMSETARIGW
jgi:hypothetical protein